MLKIEKIIREMIVDLTMADITLNCDKEKFDNSWCNTDDMCAADALSRGDLETFNTYVKEKFPEITFTFLKPTDIRVRDAESRWSKILDSFVNGDGFEINTSTKQLLTPDLV